MNILEELVTAITTQFGAIVTQITNVFAHNMPSIMTVMGLSICLTVGIKLVKKMKSL